jgi:fumarate hydratase class II
VHPNDDVNCAQSSNDVIPTAIHVAACLLAGERLLPALAHLAGVIDVRARELDGIVKTGRTHLMDAVPLTLGQELGGWRSLVLSSVARFESTLPRVRALAIGGTSVGTGLNAPHGFGAAVCAELAQLTHTAFVPAPDYFAALGSQDAAVELSGQARACAVSLTKIANDLRWMNSGPLAGLGEIRLPALQPGSSIMPGKVNPVIPEAVLMVAAQVIGNDATVALGGQSGNFQLNVMLPVIGYNLLQSLELLAGASRALADQAIEGFTVNEPRLTRELARNPVLATALNPVIGYEQAAQIAKAAAASGESVESVALRRTELDRTTLAGLLDPRHLTRGGGAGGTSG